MIVDAPAQEPLSGVPPYLAERSEGNTAATDPDASIRSWIFRDRGYARQ